MKRCGLSKSARGGTKSLLQVLAPHRSGCSRSRPKDRLSPSSGLRRRASATTTTTTGTTSTAVARNGPVRTYIRPMRYNMLLRYVRAGGLLRLLHTELLKCTTMYRFVPSPSGSLRSAPGGAVPAVLLVFAISPTQNFIFKWS
jgi:hypothetical protein